MEKYRRIAERAALAGGEVIASRLGSELTVDRKQNFDFVTEVDRAAEAAVRAVLAEEAPECGFLGEESAYLAGKTEEELLAGLSEDEYVWIVDPLDGTTNFIRGIPQFCVSVGLVRGKQPAAGAVYDVSRREMFSAALGAGATLNGAPIRVSRAAELKDAILGASFPAAEIERRGPVLRTIERLQTELGSLRIYNSAAIMLCYIACGRLDAGFERGIHSWDMAAGALLVREAGGEVRLCDGGPWSPGAGEHLSGPAPLLDALLPALN
ncbi:MAG: inositol monophosphatase [Clostridia bacterium]|nr:inositol monophosphatase [Clostridia bacterium]